MLSANFDTNEAIRALGIVAIVLIYIRATNGDADQQLLLICVGAILIIVTPEIIEYLPFNLGGERGSRP